MTKLLFIPVSQPGDPDELARLQAEAKDFIINSLTLQAQMQKLTPHERQRKIHQMQDTFSALKYCYPDSSLEFVALHLAWECARVAWYAVGGDTDGAARHMQDVDGAVHWVVTRLLKELDEAA